MKGLKFIPARKKNLRRLNEIVNDKDVSKYLTLAPPVTMKSTIEWYRSTKRAKNFWWAAMYKGEIVGSVGLRRKGTPPKMGHIVEMGVAIAKTHWGKGLGRAAILYAKRQAKKLGFKRLELYVVKDNRGALKSYLGCGFKKEGVMKNYMKIGRKYCDAVMMSVWL